jgi:hypothetical protein
LEQKASIAVISFVNAVIFLLSKAEKTRAVWGISWYDILFDGMI